MMFCKNCGKEMEPEAKFCIICGATASSEDAKSFCANCGKELKPEAVFCPSCGVNVTSVQAQTYTVPVVNYVPVVTYQPVVQAPVAVPNPPTQSYAPPAPDQPAYNPVDPNDQVIRRISCGPVGRSKLVILLVMFAFIVFRAMFSPDKGKYSEPAMGAFFIIMGIICIALGVVLYIMYQKRFCEVRANSIGGVTCGSVDFINKKYELNYADIVSVQKNRFTQLLNVRTRYNKSVKILLPPKELDYVQGVIQQKINMQTQQMYN